METNEIYLTIREVESLIANKILVVGKGWKDNRKTKIRIFFDPEGISEDAESQYILFSGVSKFEIPEKDKSLFKHYQLPEGLIETKSRKSSSRNAASFLDQQTWNSGIYNRIRRGLFALLLYGYHHEQERKMIKRFLTKMKDTLANSPGEELMRQLSEHETFPEMRNNKVQPFSYYRYLWWGKFVTGHLLSPAKGKMPEQEMNGHLEWLRSVKVHEPEKNRDLFQQVPSLIKKEEGLWLGYLAAAASADDEHSTPEEKIRDFAGKSGISVKGNNSFMLWGLFFQAFFNERVDRWYPNPLIRKEMLLLERYALGLVMHMESRTAGTLLPDEKEINTLFAQGDTQENQLILHLEQLTKGTDIKKMKVIDDGEAIRIYSSSPLAGKKLENSGFINYNIPEATRLIVDNKRFEFCGSLTGQTTIFYGELSPEQKKDLKQSGICIRTRDLKKILPAATKVVVLFTSDPEADKEILRLLGDITLSMKNKKTELIVIWEITDHGIDILSTTFAIRKKNTEEWCEKITNRTTTLLVKGPQTHEREIIRGLHIALRPYKSKGVVVAGHSFTEEHALWLAEADGEHVLKARIKDPYVLDMDNM